MSEDTTQPVSKKDQIIHAALAEFRENGFAAVSMDRVSTRAGVSKRTVYKYFESKDQLFLAIIVQMWEQISARVKVRYRPGVDIRTLLTALAEAKGQVLTDAEVMATSRLVVSEIIRSPELADETQNKLEYRAVFVDMLRAATADGQLEIPDPEEAADEFLGLLKAKAFWPVIFGAPVVDEAEMSRIVESTVSMMLSRYSGA